MKVINVDFKSKVKEDVKPVNENENNSKIKIERYDFSEIIPESIRKDIEEMIAKLSATGVFSPYEFYTLNRYVVSKFDLLVSTKGFAIDYPKMDIDGKLDIDTFKLAFIYQILEEAIKRVGKGKKLNIIKLCDELFHKSESEFRLMLNIMLDEKKLVIEPHDTERITSFLNVIFVDEDYE